jgi:prefoldin subunit 5
LHDGAREDRLDIRLDLGAEIDELEVSISSLRNDMEDLFRAAAADISQLEREINDLEDDVCGFSGCFGVESLQEEIERLSRCVRSFQDAADRIWSGYRGEWYWCADRGL